MPRDALSGPDRAAPGEIDRINRVFSEAFTDRYQRDGLSGVRVPLLNPAIWRFAIAAAGDGALVWRDASGAIAAFNMVHRSGAEGWMGPLAVRPDRQGEGLGSLMVRTGIDWLRSQGATTIGLETMPRTVDNIGFYSRIGLVPGHLTVTLVRDVPRRASAAPDARAAPSTADDEGLAACRRLADALLPGVDFTREIALTRELAIGDITRVREGGETVAFALWHSTPLASGRPKDELRVLKLVARDAAALDRVLDALPEVAARERVARIAIRCQSEFPAAYLRLIERGYRVHWTDLRMTLQGFGQRAPREGIVMSNWEI